jgi:histidinol-phosphate aminotransferase
MEPPRLRSMFEHLADYRPARVVRSPAGRSHLLAANESPHAPPPDVVEAVALAAATVNRYPDFAAGELLAQIARAHDLSQDQVALGAGSVALIQMLLQAVAEADAEVVYAWRSFELYPVLTNLAGLAGVAVPLVDERHDLGSMAGRVGDRTRLILICNPNNPTGTLLGPQDLHEFLHRVPADRLVAVDEAYLDYARGPAATSAIALCATHPNLVVLRTFSKAYGLAGLRVGYLVGAPYVVAQLRKACLPYSVSTVAQAAASAALDRRADLLARTGDVVAERRRVRRSLCAGGWEVPPSEANFVWLRLGAGSAEFGLWCGDLGVSVRAFPGEGVRVSIGSPADNDAFLAAAASWQETSEVPAVTGDRLGQDPGRRVTGPARRRPAG